MHMTRMRAGLDILNFEGRKEWMVVVFPIMFDCL